MIERNGQDLVNLEFEDEDFDYGDQSNEGFYLDDEEESSEDAKESKGNEVGGSMNFHKL